MSTPLSPASIAGRNMPELNPPFVPPVPSGARQRSRALSALVTHSALVMLAVLFVLSASMSDAFLSQGNLFNLMRQLTPLLLVSIGMLLVINTGGIDLSVGSVATAGGLCVAMLVPLMPSDGAFGLLLAVALSVLLGAVFITVKTGSPTLPASSSASVAPRTPRTARSSRNAMPASGWLPSSTTWLG